MQQGIGFYDCAKLSKRWLETCEEFLAHHGSSFDAQWSGNLSHVRTRGTATSGAALITFSVNGKVGASLALVRGTAPAVDTQVLTMFVNSLRKVSVVQAASSSPASAFSSVLSIRDRPLMVVVPWPDETIADDDHELVRELALHTAGAFLACGRGV